MFTDMVGSTEVAAELGDRRWRELLARHHRMVRAELRRFGGREIDTAGDGFFATFDRPAQGIRCAWSVAERVRELGIEVRAGLHVGEAELMGKQVGGVAVHVGARIGAQAGPGEVLVSGTIRELVPGAGIQFEDRGLRNLKGVSEPQRLHAVEAVDGKPRTRQLTAEEASRRRAQIVPPAPLKRRGVLVVGVLLLVLALVAAALFVGTDDGKPKPPPAENAVARLDEQTGRVGRLIRLPLAAQALHASDLQIGEGGVWVSAESCLCRIDLRMGELRRVFSRYPPMNFDRMALGLRAVWLVGVKATGQPILIGIDPVTLELDVQGDPLDAQNVFGVSVATAGGSVWVGFRGQLVEFDPHTGEVLGQVSVHVSVDGLVSSGDDLWIVDALGGSLHRFDAGRGGITDSIELPGAADDLAVEPDGTLWVLDELAGTLTRIDPTGQPDDPVNVGSDPLGVAAAGGAVWVADGEGNSVKEIDPVTLEVLRTIELPGEPAQIGVDARTGDVWIYFA
jgi:streptogramin lyase